MHSLAGHKEYPQQELKPFWSRRIELALVDDYVLWGFQIVVPKAGHAKLLSELNDRHPGIYE